MTTRHRSPFDDAIGFLLGFFGGCCGLLFAFVLFRGESVRGAVMGIVAQIGLTVLVAFLTEFVALSNQIDLATLRWEPFAVFGVCTVFLLTTIATGVWAFAGTDEDGAREPSRDIDYVTFDRR